MRFAIVRGWAALGTAILAAVCSDAATEFAQNIGWLGGAVQDNRHEAVWPALLLGAFLTTSLVLFVLFARIRSGDPLLSRMGDLWGRILDLAGSLLGSGFCVVAMEGYETRFGGLSPFDARSVVVAHALPLIAACVLVGAIVHFALHGAVRTASRAGEAVAEAFVQFLNALLGNAAIPRTLQVAAFVLRVVHAPLAIAYGSRGLRAPPRAVLSLYVVT